LLPRSIRLWRGRRRSHFKLPTGIAAIQRHAAQLPQKLTTVMDIVTRSVFNACSTARSQKFLALPSGKAAIGVWALTGWDRLNAGAKANRGHATLGLS